MPATRINTRASSDPPDEVGGYVDLDWERLVSELERDSALRRRVLAAPFSNEWPDLQLAQWICRAIDVRLAALAVLVAE